MPAFRCHFLFLRRAVLCKTSLDSARTRHQAQVGREIVWSLEQAYRLHLSNRFIAATRLGLGSMQLDDKTYGPRLHVLKKMIPFSVMRIKSTATSCRNNQPEISRAG